MKRLLLLLLFISLIPISTLGQERPKVDFFGGYQLLNVDAGDIANRQNSHGWNLDLAMHLNRHFSIVTDIGGNYKTFLADTGVLGGENVKARIHTFLFGPRVGVTKGKVKPFAEALFGLAHLSGDAFAETRTFNKFGMAFGGGLDVQVAPKVSLRVAKLDYLMIRFNDDEIDVHENLNNVRYSTGIVFNF